jgi:hypothetical protein
VPPEKVAVAPTEFVAVQVSVKVVFGVPEGTKIAPLYNNTPG